MRIMQVMAGAERGGAETAFVDMCLALRAAGLDQMVVTRSNDLRVPQLEKAGIAVKCLPFGGTLDFYTPWKMKSLIAAYRPQIVQTWMSRASWKTPSDPARYLKISRLGGYYALKYFRTTDYFTTITPGIREYLIGQGISSERIRHINNFAETEAVSKPLRKSDLNTPEDATALLVLARLHPSKAIDTLIRAVADLPAVHVWIAGEGGLRGELEALARDLGIAERIHFLGWRSDRAALLQACDICVFPSRYEPFGTVFVQAWANRVPVICSRADGPRQFVRDGEDGLLFDIDDVNGLTAALEKLISDKELQSRLAEAGYARYQNEFTKERTVQAYLDFYAESLERAGIAT
jgi:glycosyltransferase involved in cell wall biosynthesis